MKALLYILLPFLLISCMTEKKMSRITNEYLDDHPDVLAKKCAEEFPLIDSIYIQGPVIHDTLTKDSIIKVPITFSDDTLFVAFKSGYDIGFQEAARKCAEKPIRVRVDTIKRRDHFYEQVLQNRIDSVSKEDLIKAGRIVQLSDDLKKARKQRNLYLILLIVAGVGAIGLTYKKITGFFGFK